LTVRSLNEWALSHTNTGASNVGGRLTRIQYHRDRIYYLNADVVHVWHRNAGGNASLQVSICLSGQRFIAHRVRKD